MNFEQIKKNQSNLSIQKHLCILNYFKLFYQNLDKQNELIYFRRKCENDIPTNDTPISNFEETNKRIQEIDEGNILVDFADSNIGGLLLDANTLAQEQMLFFEHPETIVSTLLFKPLEIGYVILISNTIQYNNSVGYQLTFQWRESKNNLIHHILAINAINYQQKSDQFLENNWQYELLKCYVGFKLALSEHPKATIATGKWGCGVFNGNQEVKFLLQLYGFSLAKQNLNLNDNTIRFSSSIRLNYFDVKQGAIINYNILKNLIHSIKKGLNY